MNEFKRLHPLVNIIYYIAIIVFSCIYNHPVYPAIALLTGFFSVAFSKGWKGIKEFLLYLAFPMAIYALVNPLFSHEGENIIAYLPNGSPITAEAVFFGITSALMLWSVICHLSGFNEIITSDKIMYLTGHIMPSIGLCISVILGLVPKFMLRFKNISAAKKAISPPKDKGGLIYKIKFYGGIITAMVSSSFEDAIDTADSMKSRGYGIKKRTSYTNYRIKSKDIISLLYVLFLSAYILAGSARGEMYFEYYPTLKYNTPGIYSLSIYIAYILLFSYPVTLEIKEAIKWIKLKSKI